MKEIIDRLTVIRDELDTLLADLVKIDAVERIDAAQASVPEDHIGGGSK